MENKILVPVCLLCDKPHYGRSKVEDRCVCDGSGMWEMREIIEESNTNKEI